MTDKTAEHIDQTVTRSYLWQKVAIGCLAIIGTLASVAYSRIDVQLEQHGAVLNSLERQMAVNQSRLSSIETLTQRQYTVSDADDDKLVQARIDTEQDRRIDTMQQQQEETIRRLEAVLDRGVDRIAQQLDRFDQRLRTLEIHNGRSGYTGADPRNPDVGGNR